MPLHSLPDFQYLCLLIPHHLVWQHRHSLPHQLHHNGKNRTLGGRRASIFQESICTCQTRRHQRHSGVAAAVCCAVPDFDRVIVDDLAENHLKDEQSLAPRPHGIRPTVWR
ncbi:hypothetical protein KCV05_g257, partial [Aureobasidium melanogenum]